MKKNENQRKKYVPRLWKKLSFLFSSLVLALFLFGAFSLNVQASESFTYKGQTIDTTNAIKYSSVNDYGTGYFFSDTNTLYVTCLNPTSDTSGYYYPWNDLYALEKADGINICFADNITTIPKYAFDDCGAYILTIDFNNVTTIEDEAFWRCRIKGTLNTGKVTTIGTSAFNSCYAKAIELPCVTSIGSKAFYDCDSLTSADMPSVTSVGWDAFWSCDSLTTVSMPSVKTIGSDAFCYCESLTTVNMPLVETIGSDAFGECTALTTVNMASVKTIGEGAFGSCKNLVNIDIPNCTSIGKWAFFASSQDFDPMIITYVTSNNQAVLSYDWEVDGRVLPTTELTYYVYYYLNGVKQDNLTIEAKAVVGSTVNISDYKKKIKDDTHFNTSKIGSNKTAIKESSTLDIAPYYYTVTAKNEMRFTENIIYMYYVGDSVQYSVQHYSVAGKLFETETRTGTSYADAPVSYLKNEYTGYTYKNSGNTYIYSGACVKLYYEPTVYNITYNLDGGTAENNPSSYTIETATFTLNSPTKAGHTFLGWTTTEESTSYLKNYSVKKGSTGEITLYANWLKVPTITFDGNGGTFGDGTTYKEYEISTGSYYGTIETPSYTNHTFNGWYTEKEGGTKVNTYGSMTFTDDTVLYAKWTSDALTVSLEKVMLTADGKNLSSKELRGIVTNDLDASLSLKVTPRFSKGGSTQNLQLLLYYVSEEGDILLSITNMDGTGQETVTGQNVQAGFTSATLGFAEIALSTNGRYKVVAKDRSDENITAESNVVEVTHFDTLAPLISSVIMENAEVPTRNKTITVTATDGVAGFKNVSALNSTGSFFIEKAEEPRTDFSDVTWKGYDTSPYEEVVTENGSYYVYVRDFAGNISSYEENPIVVGNIDSSAPLVTFHNVDSYIAQNEDGFVYSGLEIASGDGINADLTYYAYDNLSQQEVTFKVNSFDESGYFTNVALLSDEEGNAYGNTTLYGNGSVWFAFFVQEDVDITVTVTDKAGNQTSCDIVIDCDLRFVDGMPLIDGNGNITISQSPSDWTNENTVLTPSIKDLSYSDSCFLWSQKTAQQVLEAGTFAGAGTWSAINTHSVSANGTYYLYVKTTNDRVYYKSYTVNNIDKTIPVISNIQVSADGKNVSFTVSDNDSGLSMVIGDGGTQSSIREETELKGTKTKSFSFPISGNGTYTVTAIDMCGNKAEVKRVITISTPTVENTASYTVNFLTYTGGIVKSENVKQGEDATPPVNLSREGYLFTGWDKSYVNVNENLEVNAVWQKIGEDKVFYSVSFVNHDGGIIKSQTVEKGGDAKAPTNLTREGYLFVGWDKPYSYVTEDLFVNAVWEEDAKAVYFTVSFVNWDKGIIKTEKVKQGGTATPPVAPSREGFLFAGWDKSFSNVTEDFSVNAVWLQQTKDADKASYVVAFTNYDDSVIKAQAVESGGTANPPIATRDGYTFTGWSKSYANVNGDVVTKAMFSKNPDNSSASGSSGNVSNNTGSSSASGTVAKKEEVTNKKEEIVKDVSDKPVTEDTADTKDKYIAFDEFAQEATLLSVSYSDNKNVGTGSAVESSKEEEKDIIKDMYEKENETVENTQDGEYEESGVSARTIISILILVACAGFGVFYFLNKKYCWVSLPF